MANNTMQLVLIGGIGLAAIYLLTNRNTGQTPYYPTQPTLPPTQTQQQQLLNWAQTQNAATTITNIIKNLDWQGIADMWGKIFGSNTSPSYSGGGTDIPYNPYPEYDPYYTGGEIWV